MKKFIILLSVLILSLTFFVACNSTEKQNGISEEDFDKETMVYINCTIRSADVNSFYFMFTAEKLAQGLPETQYIGFPVFKSFVLSNDYSALLNLLPKRDDVIVVQGVMGDRHNLTESFERFEWKIAYYNANYEKVGLLDLTEENWKQAVRESNEWGVGFELDYELADINKEISIEFSAIKNKAGQPFCIKNTDALVNQTWLVQRDDFASVLSVLPTVDEIVRYSLIYNDGVNAQQTDYETDLASIQWYIYLPPVDEWGFSGIKSWSYADLTEENFRKYTEQTDRLKIAFSYVRKDEDFEIPIEVRSFFGNLDGIIIATTFADSVSDRFEVDENEVLKVVVSNRSYAELISILPTIDEIIVTERKDWNEEYKISDKQIKTIKWQIYTSYYNNLDQSYDLTEENWNYLTLRSYKIRLNLVIEFEE